MLPKPRGLRTEKIEQLPSFVAATCRPASRYLFAGNDLCRGVYAARGLAMKRICFKSKQGTQEEKDVEPDHIVCNFPELPSAIRFFEGEKEGR